jgi:DNA-binding YbaB/EbfC family protein
MNMQKLLQMGQQMQSRMTEIQESLGKKEVTASAGGGMVTVTVNGKGEVTKVQVDPTVVDPADVEMLEDLILAAISEAQGKARGSYEEEMKKLMGGLPLPMKLPGLF